MDDDFAKGEEIHALLRENVEDYLALAMDFQQAVSIMSRERAIAGLDVFKDNDQMLLYWSNRFILDAEDLCAYLSSVEVVKNTPQIDAGTYREFYDYLAASYEEFAVLASDERAKREGVKVMFSMFKGSVTDVKAAAADIAQDLENGKKVNVSRIERLFEKHGEMIDRYNSVIR